MRKRKNLLIMIGIAALACLAFFLFHQNQPGVKLTITIPSETGNPIAYGRHFIVEGNMEGTVPDNAILRVELINNEGKTVRYAETSVKNNPNLYLFHPDITYAAEDHDPERKMLSDYGYPELVVEDLDHPMDSFTNAAIKCTYSDNSFKALIVSGTDTEHGQYRNDGIGFTDENGNPYTVLEKGNYTLQAVIKNSSGKVLGSCEKNVAIAPKEEMIIARFQPDAQRMAVWKWANENGFGSNEDRLPGFFYTDKEAHSGLLNLYRASDLALYGESRANMIIYLMEEFSSSYSVELASYQTRGLAEDENWIRYYCYPGGEPLLVNANGETQEYSPVLIEPDEKLLFCRCDYLDETVEDGLYQMDGSQVKKWDLDIADGITVTENDRFALQGVVVPFQLSEKDIQLDETTGICTFTNGIRSMKYECVSDVDSFEITKPVSMRRVGVGNTTREWISMLEFYHSFNGSQFQTGHTYTVTVTGLDANGNEVPDARQSFQLQSAAVSE